MNLFDRIGRRIEIEINQLLVHPSRLIFNLGLHKSGTTSFHTLMHWLGIKSLHCYPPLVFGGGLSSSPDTDAVYDTCLKEQNVFQDYQAFSDQPFCIPEVFMQIKERYSDAFFVYTQRNADSWANSVLKHFSQDHFTTEINYREATQPGFNRHQDLSFTKSPVGMVEMLYKKPLTQIDFDFLVAFHQLHLEAVRDICGPNLLVLDLASKAMTKELTDFIGIRKQHFIQFPHEKKGIND